MTICKTQNSLSPVLLQVPGVIVMELESSSSCTADPHWQRIVVAFNASSKEYIGVLPSVVSPKRVPSEGIQAPHCLDRPILETADSFSANFRLCRSRQLLH